MVVKRNLPGGRGYRTGPDAFVNQSESFAQRLANQPSQQGVIFSSQMTDTKGTIAGAAVVIADRLQFLRIRRLEEDYSLVKARVRVTSNAAGTLIAAIYFYGDKVFKMVPGTSVSFSTVTSGFVDKTIAAELIAGNEYWIGTALSSVTPQVLSLNMDDNQGPELLQYSATTTELRSEYPLTILASTNPTAVPCIWYYSKIGKELFLDR